MNSNKFPMKTIVKIILRQVVKYPLKFLVLIFLLLVTGCDNETDIKPEVIRLTKLKQTATSHLNSTLSLRTETTTWQYDQQQRVLDLIVEEAFPYHAYSNIDGHYSFTHNKNRAVVTSDTYSEEHTWNENNQLVKIVYKNFCYACESVVQFGYAGNKTIKTDTQDSATYVTIYTWDEKMENIIRSEFHDGDEHHETVYEYDNNPNPFILTTLIKFHNTGVGGLMLGREFEILHSKNNIVKATRTINMGIFKQVNIFTRDFLYNERLLPVSIVEQEVVILDNHQGTSVRKNVYLYELEYTVH
jgi:hypothetical protein